MPAPVTKLDSALISAGLVVWAGLTLYAIDRLVDGQIDKLGRLAQNGLVVGAFAGCSILNVVAIAVMLRRRDPSPRFRLTIAALLLVLGLVDIGVLYATWHGAQPVSV